VQNHIAYGDPNGGLNGAAALLTALLHRKRTGQGQHIDLSQVQALLPLAAPWVIEQSLTGKATRYGNRHPVFSPHGVFPCRGDDEWVLIAVEGDAAWPRLCHVIGREDLAADAGLATVEGRRTRQAELEVAIALWTARQDRNSAITSLQGEGVAAGPVQAPSELYKDPHLAARNAWQVVDREWSGPQPILAAPFREDGRPYWIERPAPTIGQHNREVLCVAFGLSEAELERLLEAGVCGYEVTRVL